MIFRAPSTPSPHKGTDQPLNQSRCKKDSDVSQASVKVQTDTKCIDVTQCKNTAQSFHLIDGTKVMTLPNCKHCVDVGNIVIDLAEKYEFENLISMAQARCESRKPFFLIASLVAEQHTTEPIVNYYQGSSILNHWYHSIARKTQHLIDPNTQLNTQAIRYYLLPRTSIRADYVGESKLADVKHNTMTPLVRLSVAAETATKQQSEMYSLIFSLLYIHGAEKLFPKCLFGESFTTLPRDEVHMQTGLQALHSILDGKSSEAQAVLFKQSQEQLGRVMIPMHGALADGPQAYRNYLDGLDIWSAEQSWATCNNSVKTAQ